MTEKLRVLLNGRVISPLQGSPRELYTSTLAWILAASIPFYLTASAKPSMMQNLAGVVILLAVGTTTIGHAVRFNPIFTGEAVVGWPVLNVPLLGFFLPAAIFYLLSGRMVAPFSTSAPGAASVLVFIGLWLEVKHGFQGSTLLALHQTLLKLHVTTFVWLLLAARPLAILRIGAMRGPAAAGQAVLGVSIVMLFAGHSFRFNPVFDQSHVPGPAVFNVLQLGFILPAVLTGFLSLRVWPRFQTALQVAAHALLSIRVTMLVKHTIQSDVLQLATLNKPEDNAYSAIWLLFAIATLSAGTALNNTHTSFADAAKPRLRPLPGIA